MLQLIKKYVIILLKGGGIMKKQPGVKLTLDIFKQKIKAMYGGEYTVLGDKYVNNKTKIKVKHNICGFEYEVRPDNILYGKKCPHCAGNIKRTTKDFAKLVDKITLGEYELIGEYTNNRIKVKIKHKTCGRTFDVTPDKFVGGKRCPVCGGSIGENMIELYLRSKGVAFEKEYIFTECRYKRELKFDFYIPSMKVCIEYNGMQHYEPIQAWGGEERLKIYQTRDHIKKTFCANNQLTLITIKYRQLAGEKLYNYIKEILQQYNI